jgi:hypothetical protein
MLRVLTHGVRRTATGGRCGTNIVASKTLRMRPACTSIITTSMVRSAHTGHRSSSLTPSSLTMTSSSTTAVSSSSRTWMGPHASFITRTLSTNASPSSSSSSSGSAPTPSPSSNGNGDKKNALMAALWPSLPIGIASGYVGAITGVGGALLMIPLLVNIAKVKHIEANGTSVFTTLVSAITGAATFASYGAIHVGYHLLPPSPLLVHSTDGWVYKIVTHRIFNGRYSSSDDAFWCKVFSTAS